VSVAATYAEALYEAAVDGGAVPAVAAGLEGFLAAADESPELHQALLNPEIDTAQKKAVVAALTSGAPPLLANFLQVLLDRGRAEDLPAIAEAFSERVARAEGRIRVEAVTAVPLPADLRDAIVARVAAQTERQVDLTETVDPDIVGGLVLRAGGLSVDGSVRSRLDGLERQFASATLDTSQA
jgi:F-type H+-transporting ATPase subunit delta